MEMFEGNTCSISYHGDGSGEVYITPKDTEEECRVSFEDLYKFVMKVKTEQIEAKVESFVDKFVDGVSKLFNDD